MKIIKNPGKGMLSTARDFEEAARAIFELPQQNEGIEGYVENRKLFFSVVKSTIRLSDVIHKNLEAWNNSIVQRERAYDLESEESWKEVVAALVSLTGFLVERTNPFHSEGGFVLRLSPRNMLNLCHKKATRVLNNWISPSPMMPVVHEEVVLSPEGVQVWEDAMNSASSIGKPMGYKPRRLAGD